MTEYIDYSDSQIQDGIVINAPKWFIDTIKAYAARNSVRLSQVEFAMYIKGTYDCQKDWINESNIGLVLQKIAKNLNYPRLPADCDWEKYRPKKEDENTKFLQDMGRYITEMITYDCLAPVPEANNLQQCAIDYCGGLNGLLQYARNYSAASANRYLKDALERSEDWGFCQTIAPKIERIGTANIGQLLKKETKND